MATGVFLSRAERLRLIDEVESRPPIWDDEDPEHKKVDVTERKWKEIGASMDKEVGLLKMKWKNLRAKMRKELLKIPLTETGEMVAGWKSQWEFYDRMAFMRDAIMRTLSISNSGGFHNADEEAAYCEVTFRASDDESASMPASPVPSSAESTVNLRTSKRKLPYDVNDGEVIVKRKRPLIDMNGEIPPSSSNSSKSTDYYFLMSLLPFIEPLDLVDKLDLREAVQKEVGKFYKKHNMKLKQQETDGREQQQISIKHEKD